jgi:hypothetical protein
MSTDLVRRKFLKSTSVAISLVPLAAFVPQARAGSNKALRSQLKYQDTPQDGKSCTSCLEFIPAKSDKALGACKVIPGDDEISPNGYCALWNTM